MEEAQICTADVNSDYTFWPLVNERYGYFNNLECLDLRGNVQSSYLLKSLKLKASTFVARINHLLVLCYSLALPHVKSYRNDKILPDLLPVDLLRCPVIKSGHDCSDRDISRHHAAAVLRRDGTSGFEKPRKAVSFTAFCERQSDLIILRLGYRSRES
jgi:hypothetical protein